MNNNSSANLNNGATLYSAGGLPTNPSLGSLFVKAPQNSSSNVQVSTGAGGAGGSLTRHNKKASLSNSDKLNSKLHLGDRPKTTMLM